MNITKKLIVLIVLAIMTLTLFGCSNNLTIREFDGLEDLPTNPDRIVFMTEQLSEDETQINKIEVDIPVEKIGYVMGILLSRTYKGLPENIAIDILNDYLRVYQGEKYWEFHIGLMRQNGRWYEPVQQDDLRAYLFSLI